MEKKRVLVACERSGVVRDAFRQLGHDAVSCDTEQCDADASYHIQGDARVEIAQQQWDIIIAHPPCTHLAVSGARHFAQKRKDGRQQQGIDLFMDFVNECEASGARWCLENPVGIMSSLYRKPNQYVQPWQFGHPESKKTGLWLSGLPLLVETNNVKAEYDELPLSEKHRIHRMPPSADRAKKRSVTFTGIAEAMASQWGRL